MSNLINSKIRTILQSEEPVAEQINRLTDKQLEIIYQQKWFKMYVPENLGGLELNLFDAVSLQENLAYIDGSLAWTITLCAGAVYFIGFIDSKFHSKLFLDPHTCWGGSGMTNGTAKVEGSSYRINGNWRFATGSSHNTIFTANCWLLDENNVSICDKFGNPQYSSFFFDKNEVQVYDDWNTMGLRSTSSHGFEVNNLLVPEQHMFQINPESATLSEKIFRYPFMAFAQFTLAANYLGMMESFMDELQNILNLKKSPSYSEINEAQRFLSNNRIKFYNLLKNCDSNLERNHNLTSEEIIEIETITRELVKNGLQHVTHCFPFAGMHGVEIKSRINRIWRNLFTASQHSIFRNS